MSTFGFASLGVVLLYLALFFMASGWAARAAGQPVWLFGQATGADRWSALGFRLAFVLAVFGPLLQAVFPRLHQHDPLWLELGGPLWGSLGHFVAIAGAMLAFAAQVSMGASWRVGVAEDALGDDLVTGGPFEISRNPVFAGQFLLLFGVFLAVPSVPTLAAVALFWLSARSQVRTEERILENQFGPQYQSYRARVPRWIGWINGSLPQ